MPRALIGLRPRPSGVVLRCSRNERPVELHPKPLPLDARKAFVCQVVGLVAVASQEGVAYGSLVGCRWSQPEGRNDALGVHHQRYLEPVDPLGLGGTAFEGCLPTEEPLAR